MEILKILFFYILPFLFFTIGIYHIYKYVVEKRKKSSLKDNRNDPNKSKLADSYLQDFHLYVNTSILSPEQKFALVDYHLKKRIYKHQQLSILSITIFVGLFATQLVYYNYFSL